MLRHGVAIFRALDKCYWHSFQKGWIGLGRGFSSQGRKSQWAPGRKRQHAGGRGSGPQRGSPGGTLKLRFWLSSQLWVVGTNDQLTLPSTCLGSEKPHTLLITPCCILLSSLCRDVASPSSLHTAQPEPRIRPGVRSTSFQPLTQEDGAAGAVHGGWQNIVWSPDVPQAGPRKNSSLESRTHLLLPTQ